MESFYLCMSFLLVNQNPKFMEFYMMCSLNGEWRKLVGVHII